LYYNHDLSLAEIGDELGITKQGVSDILKRAEDKLYNFEKNLGLVKKFYSSHNNIKKILDISQEIMEVAKEQNLVDIYNKSLKIKELSKRILSSSREVID